MANNRLSELTPEIIALSELAVKNGKIPAELYTQLQVKRGLRDVNGQGVLTGLTEISEINS